MSKPEELASGVYKVSGKREVHGVKPGGSLSVDHITVSQLQALLEAGHLTAKPVELKASDTGSAADTSEGK